MIRVLIVDKELLAGLRVENLLATMKNIEVVGVASTSSDALRVAQHSPPDILIINLSAPQFDGGWITELVAELELAPVLIFCPSFDGFQSYARSHHQRETLSICAWPTRRMLLPQFWLQVVWSTSSAEKLAAFRAPISMFILILV